MPFGIPKIIAVSETKLNNSFCNHLDGYKFVQANSDTNAGGVGIFVKNTIDFSVVNDYKLDANVCENIWIEINLTNNKKCVIGVIYRHPLYQISNFQDSFEISLNKLSNNNMNVYICGDINVDLLKCNNQPMIQKYSDMLFSMGCIPLINMPTRITNHSATLIDHIYTNNVKYDIQSYILLHDISDHLPVCALINNMKTRTVSHKNFFRDTRNFVTEKFIEDLASNLFDINEITPTNRLDVNEMSNKFVDIFANTLEKHAPLKKTSRKQKKLQQKPWITKAILISVKKKNKLYEQFLKGDREAEKLYKVYRNKLTHLKEISKKMYYNDIINKAKHDSSLIWRVINDILKFKKKSSNCSIEKLVNENGEIIQHPQEVAELFNQHFSGIGSKVAKKAPPISSDCNFSTLSFIKRNSSSLFFHPITEQEVLIHLRELNSSKSSGLYGIPIKYVKMSSLIIAPVLTHLYNCCITVGTFPDVFKLAEIIPLYKKGSNETCSNYRPISLLSPFSKIFEKCLYKRIVEFFNKHNLFNQNQFGFRENCSTSHAVSEICSDFYENRDAGNITCSIFLDLEKAFDTVNHTILLSKLCEYGVRGLPLNLLESYLSNRRHFTVVNGCKSTCQNLHCGVPQGSTLGPLLFIIYINDLPLVSKLRTRLFADDTSLTFSRKSLSNLEVVVNQEMSKIANWMSLNKLSINYNKTEFLVISNNNKQLKLKLMINNKEIKQKQEIKYLGVIIDNKLSWKAHIKLVCSKLAKGCYALIKLRNLTNVNTLKIIYYSMVYTHIQYCIAVWGTAYKSSLLPLEKMQKKILKIMAKASFTAPSLPLFLKYNFLKVQDIFKLEIAKLMHGIYKNLNKPQFSRFKSISTRHAYNTRHAAKKNYCLPTVKTNFGKSTLQFVGPKIWQDVPSALKSLPISLFKKRYKSYLNSLYI